MYDYDFSYCEYRVFFTNFGKDFSGSLSLAHEIHDGLCCNLRLDRRCLLLKSDPSHEKGPYGNGKKY